MIASRPKPTAEIVEYLNGQDRIVLVACTGCPEGCASGDPEQLARLCEELAEAGKTVSTTIPVDFLCNRSLIARRLIAHLDEFSDADAVLESSCGIGVQAVAAKVDKATNTVHDTISMGVFRGLLPGEERCRECGDCVLHYTGGICPRVACSKGLISGQCGGADADGSCEVDRAMECGWIRIYERLRKIGRLDLMDHAIAPLDHRNLTGDVRHRKTNWWTLEEAKRGAQLPDEQSDGK